MPSSEFSHTYSYSPWLRLKMDVWEELIERLKPVVFKKNALIFQPHHSVEHVYLVNSGRVRVAIIDSLGEEQAIFIAERGVPVGEASVLLQHNPHTSAIAIVESSLYQIPRQMFIDHMEKNRAFAMHIFQLQSYEKMAMVKLLWMLSFCDAKQRVVYTLLNLLQHYGEREENGTIRISVKFTHSDLAGIINTSRVTVNNVFTQLIADGIIEKAGGYYHIHKPRQLEELVDFESDF